MTRRLDAGTRLILASHNTGKLAELAALVRPHGVELMSAGNLGLPEPDETAPDFVGNAKLKALVAATASGLPALADDSGFCVAALRGAPGVFSARWAGPAKDFAAAMQRVRDESAGSGDDRAWFICALSLAWPDGETATFIGRVDGTLTWPPRGDRGFGYDPIFTPLRASKTFAEMEPSEKHAQSHRARAMAQLRLACFPPATAGAAAP